MINKPYSLVYLILESSVLRGFLMILWYYVLSMSNITGLNCGVLLHRTGWGYLLCSAWRGKCVVYGDHPEADEFGDEEHNDSGDWIRITSSPWN